jgi:hypothetical protein
MKTSATAAVKAASAAMKPAATATVKTSATASAMVGEGRNGAQGKRDCG